MLAYVQGVRVKLDRGEKLAETVDYSSKKQVKEWFNRTAQSKSFMAGDQVLILTI